MISILSLLLPQALAAPDTTKLTNIASGFVDIANVVTTILFVLAIAVFAWGIVKLIWAAGDANAVREARGIITWGLIAIAVLASLYGVVKYLQTVVGVGTGDLDIQQPKITPGGSVMPPI